jgi:hypothetical protein
VHIGSCTVILNSYFLARACDKCSSEQQGSKSFPSSTCFYSFYRFLFVVLVKVVPKSHVHHSVCYFSTCLLIQGSIGEATGYFIKTSSQDTVSTR